MRERPILFSGAMVRALLAGTKAQTRRIVRKQFADDAVVAEVGATTPEGWQISGHSGLWWDDAAACLDDAVRCPFGMPGDRLWVRENFGRVPTACEGEELVFAADFSDGSDRAAGVRYTPSIHMPRALSRILLEITEVRVERLQDISRGDAMAEGCPFPNMAQGDDPRRWYAELWDSINGSGGWAANPWVWAVSFRRLESTHA